MDRKRLRKLLDDVRRGTLPVAAALDELRMLPVDDLGFAKLDLHRAVRRGFPEVIYGPGKTAEQIVALVERLHAAGQAVLVTRVAPEAYEAVAARFPAAEYHDRARLIVLRKGRRGRGRAGIMVVTAGTSDIPVAEEAAVTAEVMGNRVERVYDVGVAGIHRLGPHQEALLRARVVVVVAGMEGALPSVVAGLADCPVIGVPTSVGYGVASGGQAALMAMLSSCATGMTVVNIDNGFGAGYAAALINRGQGRRGA
jgi:NCAIR mutase (PurE)-related protein